MSKEIEIFKSEEFGEVRTVLINEEVWFVGKDVATALGYNDTNQAIRKHVDEEDKATRRFDGVGYSTNAIIINESGLYSLVLSSKLPSAKKFKHWITSEVLPSIRKYGAYNNSIKALEEAKQYYKINSKTKLNTAAYIKKRLGINKTNDEYRQVKMRVFMLLGVNKWEDISLEKFKESINIIDESIRIIKMERPYEQINFFK